MISSSPVSVAYRHRLVQSCISSLAQADIGPLHALIVNGEEREAQKFLLADFLGRLHGLLIVDCALLLVLHLAGRKFLLKPLDLLLAEHLPYLKPVLLG